MDDTVTYLNERIALVEKELDKVAQTYVNSLMDDRAKLLSALSAVEEPGKATLVAVEGTKEDQPLSKKRGTRRVRYQEKILTELQKGPIERSKLIKKLGGNTSAYRALRRLIDTGSIVEDDKMVQLPEKVVA